jgi:hypothetical protein
MQYRTLTSNSINHSRSNPPGQASVRGEVERFQLFAAPAPNNRMLPAEYFGMYRSE